jgi:hypothetical protein
LIWDTVVAGDEGLCACERTRAGPTGTGESTVNLDVMRVSGVERKPRSND